MPREKTNKHHYYPDVFAELLRLRLQIQSVLSQRTLGFIWFLIRYFFGFCKKFLNIKLVFHKWFVKLIIHLFLRLFRYS